MKPVGRTLGTLFVPTAPLSFPAQSGADDAASQSPRLPETAKKIASDKRLDADVTPEYPL